MDSKSILLNYLHKYGYNIQEGTTAVSIYENNRDKFEKICGNNIFNTLDDFFTDNDDYNDLKYILIDSTGEPTSIFIGTMNDDFISSDYTCSSKLPKGGTLLRFYALLSANEKNKNITKLTGGISGGIPAINENDSKEYEIEKRLKLKKYHLSNGAIVNDNEFVYNLDDVKRKIIELFGKNVGGKNVGGKKCKKVKTKNTKKSKKSKKSKLIKKRATRKCSKIKNNSKTRRHR
jgi:hypothetical protein